MAESYDLTFQGVDCTCEDTKRERGGTTKLEKDTCEANIIKNVRQAGEHYARVIARLDVLIVQSKAQQGDSPSGSLSENQKAINNAETRKSQAEADKTAYKDTQILKRNLHRQYPNL